MDWDRLRIFHVVAQAKSLTDAGLELNVSQSAVSRQISALEKNLNASLFVRHARGLVLTEQGETLFKVTREIFGKISSINLMIEDIKDGLSGSICVATTVGIGSIWLAPRLKHLIKQYPKLKLNLMLTDGDVDFTMREADVCINYHEALMMQDVIQKTVGNIKMGIYASKEYIKIYGMPQKPEDFDNHRLIIFGSYGAAPSIHANWLLRFGTKSGKLRIPDITINNAYGMLQATKGGLGIAMLTDFIARDHDDLVEILPHSTIPPMKMYFTYPKSLDGLERIRVLYEFVYNQLNNVKTN